MALLQFYKAQLVESAKQNNKKKDPSHRVFTIFQPEHIRVLPVDK